MRKRAWSVRSTPAGGRGRSGEGAQPSTGRSAVRRVARVRGSLESDGRRPAVPKGPSRGHAGELGMVVPGRAKREAQARYTLLTLPDQAGQYIGQNLDQSSKTLVTKILLGLLAPAKPRMWPMLSEMVTALYNQSE
jgi:hypothetical protein